MIKNKLPFDCEILNYTKSGKKIWIHMQGQPYSDNNGTQDQYFAIQTDITESVLGREKTSAEHLTVQNEIGEAVLMALEKERNHIAREMHDNLNHTLVASKLYIEMALSDRENYVPYLTKSSEFIVEVVEEIRKISKGLISDHLLGLFQNIHALIDDIMRVHPIRISFFTGRLKEDRLDEKVKLNIFRIIQEQLTNIIKHSSAITAKITIHRIENTILLTIGDNGNGCDVTQKRNGVGIRNIETRAGLFAGSVKVLSRPGKGFKLQVSLNIN